MARLSSYTKDTTLTGKDMLAGSNYIGTVNGIDQFETNNFTLEKITQHINGQIVTDPSVISLKTNGGLVYETSNNTNYLAVNLSHTNITGQLANSDLVNSYITINGTNVQLGGSISIPIGDITAVTAGTYLNGGGTTGDITVNHDNTSRSDTTSNAAPAYGATFTAIDSITTNATGHITAANLKTITIPASDDTNTTYTVEAIDDGNDAKIRLVGANPSSTDDVKLKAGSNITINVNEGTDEIEIVGTAFGNTFTVANETAHLALNTSSGDLVIRTDQSKTYIDNGTNASPNVMSNYTELQFSGIQQIDLAEGPGIDLEDHAGNAITTLTQNNNDLKVINTLATSSERGGIKIGYTESGKNYPVELDSEKAFVNVPWVNTTYSAGVGLSLSSTTFNVNVVNNATTQIPQSVTTTANRLYQVETDDQDNLVVNVPWVDTDTNTQNQYSVSIPSSTTKLRLSGSGHDGNTTDDIEFVGSGATTVTRTNDSKFTISSTDHNTEYTAGTGLTLTGTVFSADVNATQANSATNSLSTTAGRYYAVQLDNNSTAADAKLVVNVPWTDNNDNTFRTIKVDTNDDGTANETIGATKELKLIGGTNVTLAESAGTVTITSTDTNTTNWNFKVDSGTAENIAAGNTVTFTGGTNVTLTQNGKTIDIAATDTNNYVTGASVSGTATKTLTLTRQGLGDLTAQWTDIDTQRTDEEIRDVAAAQWVNGTNTTVVVDDNADTIKINAVNTNDNYYLDGITKSGNKLTFSVNGATNQEYTFGSNAFNSTTIPTNNNQIANGAGYITSYSETDTLATVTGRGNSTSTDTTFNSHLTMGGTGHYLYAISNAANVSPTNAHGLAFSWNRSGGSRESNIVFAPGSDANSSQEADAQIRFEYKAVNGTISTAAKLWSGGNFNTAGYITVQNGGNTITNTRVGQWNTAYGWGNHASAGYSTFSGSYNDLTNKPTIPSNYLRDNADDTSSGSLTVVSYKFNGNASNPTNTTATIYDQANQGPTISGLGVCFRTGSTPSQTGKLNSSGTFTVSGDIIAYGSPSDISLKENIKPIENALDKVEKLQGVTFDWKEKQEDILNIKEDIGFIAQDVQKVLPELVRENENGKLSLRHQGVIPVLLEAIKELSNRIKVLENGGTE